MSSFLRSILWSDLLTEVMKMAFEIVNETYRTSEGEDPKKYGYIEGYTSNTMDETYLCLNVRSVPDEEIYESYKRSPGLQYFEYQIGKPYGESVRLNRRQVVRLIWELIKWLLKGW